MATQQPQAQPPPALRNHGGSVSARVLRRNIWRRLNIKNEHFMGVIVGREGSGKSHTALSICRTVDPTFDADRVFFDPADLVEAFRDDELGEGNMVMLDEAGVGLGRRSWYEKEQVLLNQTLQTVRDENMGVLYTLPRLSELDSQTVGRLHALLAMKEKHPQEGWASVSYKNVDPTRETVDGKVYRKYPRMNIDGRKHRITSIGIKRPPADLADAYEERKAEFKKGLYEQVIEAHDDTDDETTDPKAIAQTIADEGVDAVVSTNNQNGKPYINKDLIRVEYDISHSDARAVKSMLEASFSTEQLETAK
jgi:ABC-type dipeptide/oligopeptide/nickel transport system ATPase component